MDADRFEMLTRILARAPTRRRLLGLLAVDAANAEA